MIELTLYYLYIYFWLFLIYRTTLQPIKVIIIYSIYYLLSIVIRVFNYHIFVFYCWTVSFHWLDQNSLILKLVPRCVKKLSVGRIQNWHTYLLPPQFFGRFRQGCRLDVQTCLLQWIYLLDLKSPYSSSFKHFLFIADLCVSYLLYQHLSTLKLVLGCVRKLPVVRIQTGHIYLLLLRVCGRLC